MPDSQSTLIGIAVMVVVTFVTRISGYLVGTRIREGSRLHRIIETLPGCALASVVASVVAPALASGSLVEATAIAGAAALFFWTDSIMSALATGLLISIVGAQWWG